MFNKILTTSLVDKEKMCTFASAFFERNRGVAQLVSKCQDGVSLFQMMQKTYVFSGFGGLWSLFPAYDFHNVTPMSHQNSATFVLLVLIKRIQRICHTNFFV